MNVFCSYEMKKNQLTKNLRKVTRKIRHLILVIKDNLSLSKAVNVMRAWKWCIEKLTNEFRMNHL